MLTKLNLYILPYDYTGVPGITQCSIRPGNSHLYRFRPIQSGTLWWHSHQGFQRRTVYGLIIIDPDSHVENRVGSIDYDEERILLLSDWFPGDGRKQVTTLLGSPAQWIGEPATIIVNGRASIPDSSPSVQHSDRLDDRDMAESVPIVDVEPGKTYRLLVVNAAMLTYLTMGIFGHNLTIVEAETSLLQPVDVDALDIGPGQSYSVIFRTKSVTALKQLKSNGLFAIRFVTRLRNSSISAVSLLRYRSDSLKLLEFPSVPLEQNSQLALSLPTVDDIRWSLLQARALKSSPVSGTSNAANYDVPRNADRSFMIHSNEVTFPDGRVRWVVNNVSFALPLTPALHSVKFGLRDKEQYIDMTRKTSSETGDMVFGTHMLSVRMGEVVDFVFLQPGKKSYDAIHKSPHEVHTW